MKVVKLVFSGYLRKQQLSNKLSQSYYRTLFKRTFHNDVIVYTSYGSRNIYDSNLIDDNAAKFYSVQCSRVTSTYSCLNTATALLKHRLCSKTFQWRFLSSDSPNKAEWENLLDSEEKKNRIESIPVKMENIYTIPNLLSTLRIAVTPYLGYLVINQEFKPALLLLALAGISDVVDGQIARTWPSQQSAVGSALDPLADKILISVLALSLTYVNIMPVALTALYVSRDLILIIAGFYLRYRTCPRPVTLKRYFDPSLVNAKLSPTNISKANTVLQILVIWSSAAAPVFGFLDHYLLQSLWGISALTTVASGISYITRKDTVRILKDEK